MLFLICFCIFIACWLHFNMFKYFFIIVYVVYWECTVLSIKDWIENDYVIILMVWFPVLSLIGVIVTAIASVFNASFYKEVKMSSW